MCKNKFIILNIPCNMQYINYIPDLNPNGELINENTAESSNKILIIAYSGRTEGILFSRCFKNITILFAGHEVM